MARLVLVDDDPDILETLTYAFERSGHQVESIPDGELALETLRQSPPDLAVLDVMLPGLNGYEVARLLRQEMRAKKLHAFPIVMMTARRVNSDRRSEFLSTWSGVDATIWKPFDLKQLLQTVDDLLQEAAPSSVSVRE